MSEQIKVMFPVTLFYSYASADERLRLPLEKHLSLLQRQGIITSWHFREIEAGSDWQQAIDDHLSTASLILLLISPDFIASDYCYGIEMMRAMEQYQRGEACVIPVILRPTADWSTAPFGSLSALPSNRKPVTKWSNRDAAFEDIAKGIKEVIMEWFSSRTAEEWLDKCEELCFQYRCAEALRATRRVLHIDPDDIVAHIIKGRLLRESGYSKEALATFNLVLDLAPDYMAAYEEKIRVLRAEKRYDEGLEVCDQAHKQDPCFAAIYHLKGDILCQIGYYEEALTACQQSIHLDASNAEAYQTKGYALLNLRRLEEAIAACKQAIALDSHASLAYASKGLAHVGLGQNEAALEAYENFTTLDPRAAFAFHQKAEILRELQRYEEAVEACEQALRSGFHDVEVYKTMVSALMSLRRYIEALPACSKVIELEPNNARAYEFKAIILSDAGRYKEVLEACKQAIRLGLTTPTLTYCLRGDAFYKLGYYEEALAAYKEVLEYDLDSCSDWAHEGMEKTLKALQDNFEKTDKEDSSNRNLDQEDEKEA